VGTTTAESIMRVLRATVGVGVLISTIIAREARAYFFGAPFRV
jgi:hypothetical protein